MAHPIVEHIPSLRRCARALKGNHADADDLVQDTLERAYAKWHLWRRGSGVRPWQFMYETARGERVTLFLRALGEDAGPTAFSFKEEAGVSTFYWVDRDWGYALTGPLGRAALLDVAKIVYEQLGR